MNLPEEQIRGEDAILAVETLNRPRALLRWYDRERRDLPWRRTRDPYAIWVSEVMLQQTQVETVEAYYRRFLARWPDVAALAAASVEEVLAVWSGLGYYRRARQLHRAAREVARAGDFPTTPEALQELPGIGPYTAAAIASIAFEVPVPVLDGNVERVISRQLALGGRLRSAAGKRQLLAAAEAWIDPGRPGDSNQALMELGATICSPRAPRCSVCPVGHTCEALGRGEVERYPERGSRRASVRMRLVTVLAEQRGRFLLFKRSEESELLAGLWELPVVSWGADERVSAELERRYGGSWDLDNSFGSFRHSVTHRSLEVEVRGGRVRDTGASAEGPEAGWFPPEEIDELPTSALVSKALERCLRARGAC